MGTDSSFPRRKRCARFLSMPCEAHNKLSIFASSALDRYQRYRSRSSLPQRPRRSGHRNRRHSCAWVRSHHKIIHMSFAIWATTKSMCAPIAQRFIATTQRWRPTKRAQRNANFTTLLIANNPDAAGVRASGNSPSSLLRHEIQSLVVDSSLVVCRSKSTLTDLRTSFLAFAAAQCRARSPVQSFNPCHLRSTKRWPA
jgi:hypothetical protein